VPARARLGRTARLIQALERRTRASVGLPPPLVDTPERAWARRGALAAYRCPPQRCALVIGLRVASWNPFVEAGRAILAGTSTRFPGSILQRYYDRFAPRNAAEAIAGFAEAPPAFRHEPPIVAFCSPWESLTPTNVIDKVQAWTELDYVEAVGGALTLEDGFKYFGPVSPALGEAEFRRIEALALAMRRDGYLRRCGAVHQVVLKRGDEYLAVMSGGGMHRTVVAAAIGLPTIPAYPRQMVDVGDVASWPNVKSGLWSVGQARAYCDHLFDFDFSAWARELEITP
jgi:hypothetical protein